MPKFRSKEVEIEAVQWNGAGMSPPLPDWIKTALMKNPEEPGGIMRMGDTIHVFTLEGTMIARAGDWIIRGTEGELYPCKPSVFERKYEPVI